MCAFVSATLRLLPLLILATHIMNCSIRPLQKDKLIKMAPINVIFYLAIFSNGKVLQYSNVETCVLGDFLECVVTASTSGLLHLDL